MPIYNECPVCGAHLDPGERCDCLDVPERKLVTMADWEAAGDFSKIAKPGDAVEESIVDSFLNCLQPVRQSYGFIQAGEPHSHELDPKTGRWRGTYPTFQKDGSQWVYCGNCFPGEATEPPLAKRRA